MALMSPSQPDSAVAENKNINMDGSNISGQVFEEHMMCMLTSTGRPLHKYHIRNTEIAH